MNDKWILGGALTALVLASSGTGNTPPGEEKPLTDTHCHADGDCATLGVRNQNQSASCLDLLCTQVRVRLTGDVVNLGAVGVNTATLRLELYDGSGETVRTLHETVGPLDTDERTAINRTIEGATAELQSIQNGGARLIIKSWS